MVFGGYAIAFEEKLAQSIQNYDLEFLVRLLESSGRVPDFRKAQKIILKQYKREPENCFDFAVKLAQNKSRCARFTASITLGEMAKDHYKAVMPILKELASDESWEVREGAADGVNSVLGHHFELALRELKFWVASGNENLTRAVVVSVIPRPKVNLSSHLDEILDLLEKVLPDRREYVRKNLGPFCLNLMANKHPDVVLPRLREWARLKGEQVLWNVAMTFSAMFGRRHPDEALEILEIIGRDKRGYVWRAVVSALRNIGRTHPEKVLPLLKKWLKDKELKKVAEVALKYIKTS